MGKPGWGPFSCVLTWESDSQQGELKWKREKWAGEEGKEGKNEEVGEEEAKNKN